MLKKDYSEGSREIIASVTAGYNDSLSIVSDESHRVTVRTNGRFLTPRDSSGKLVSINSADHGRLIDWK